ncbi:hypothetical protein B9T26_08860 [Acinetobacter sp. ANC 4169]|uniref:hypothetical protein n=1 Tax=Acinetobacter sp. ANC 4169 TaxID=1977879 RepID=UPI000A34F1CF|nr:hypothetical protein [Acinetobacter sp. ANC 4169]OTG73187.1 hypothetical protein B9T26_08860 [Acinetobacter sp. ANC 4169]
MFKLLFILAALLCLVVWPLIYLLHYQKQNTNAFKLYMMLLSPASILLGIYLMFSVQQKDSHSKACGVVQAYQTYMTAGNVHKRKPFERVELLFDGAKYSRHLRIDGNLIKKDTGKHVCFQFYDRKLNPQMNDSKIIKWLD